MPSPKKKVTVKGTSAPKKKVAEMTAKEKEFDEAKKRLRAFLNQGTQKIRDDIELLRGGTGIKHDNCKTCRCDQADEELFYPVGYTLNNLAEYLSEDLDRLDNPDGNDDWNDDW